MEFLRNCWYVAGHTEEASQKPFVRTLLGEAVVIYRTESGVLVAMDDRCPHRFAPLHQGIVRGEELQCPYHGLRFDTGGQCVAVPTGGEPPPRARLRTYPLVSRWAMLWIWMGDAALADPNEIPDFSRLEHDDADWWSGYLHADCNYQLLVDNLLDLSHVEFIHPLLASNGWAARNEQTIAQDGETVIVKNIAREDEVMGMALHMNPKLSKTGTTLQNLRWDAPSVLQLSIEYYSETGNWIVPSGHFLTPETTVSTHYFLRGGQTVDVDNAEMTAGMRAGTLNLFQTEDIAMIEAQQRYIGDTDLMEKQPAILRADAGAIRARRILSRRIREEAAQRNDSVVETPRRAIPIAPSN